MIKGHAKTFLAIAVTADCILDGQTVMYFDRENGVRVISRRRLSRPRTRFGLITTLYWALSGYRARPARACWVLVGMFAALAALYMVFGPPKLQDLEIV
jgi:hypothetical protein